MNTALISGLLCWLLDLFFLFKEILDAVHTWKYLLCITQFYAPLVHDLGRWSLHCTTLYPVESTPAGKRVYEMFLHRYLTLRWLHTSLKHHLALTKLHISSILSLIGMVYQNKHWKKTSFSPSLLLFYLCENSFNLFILLFWLLNVIIYQRLDIPSLRCYL